MQMTQYLGTEYPEATDIADIPKQMRNIAVSWENAWGGVWLNWASPILTQDTSGAAVPIALNPATTVARVKKIRSTIYIQAMLVVLTTPALGGTPQIFLPYPMAYIDETPGIITAKWGGSSGGTAMTAIRSQVAANLTNPAVIEATNAGSLVAGDWVALHLCYETV
jgi:hypothetical protein